jgi:hypothetical protein
MKTIKKLGALAALAVLSSSALQAVTVSLTTWSSYPTLGSGNAAFTDTAGNKYYGYVLDGGTWNATDYYGSTAGIGVNSANGLGLPGYVDDLGDNNSLTYNEYLVIDFGANYLAKTAFELKFTRFLVGNFTYMWSSGLPSGSSPAAGTSPGQVDVNGTAVLNNTWQSLTGPTDRYLILGATPNGQYAVRGVQYTQVPEGGLTVTLLGAALGGLGCVGFRRRKA